MNTLKRRDGVTFALEVYRVQHPWGRASKAASHLRAMAVQHGTWVGVRRHGALVELALSHQSGYLLGESLWRHFGEPKQLVYCELLPGGVEVLLVVVRDTLVCLECCVPLAGLSAEWALLMPSDHEAFYVHGDLLKLQGALKRSGLSLEAFEHAKPLAQSAWQALALHPCEALLPINEVLRSPLLGWPDRRYLLAVLGALLVVCLALCFASSANKTVAPQVQMPLSERYHHALGFVDVANVVSSTAAMLSSLDGVPGWLWQQLDWHPGGVVLRAHGEGASETLLWAWAKSRDAGVALHGEEAMLHLPNKHLNRSRWPALMSDGVSQRQLADALRRAVPDMQLSWGDKVADGELWQQSLRLRLKGASPALLSCLGDALSKVPVRVVSVVLTRSDVLMDVSMRLNWVGSAHAVN